MSLGDRELSKMMNICEHDETGRPVMITDDEQHRPGEMSVPGDDEEGGEESDGILRCLVSERKAKRLGGDDTDCVQLSCRSAKFGEHSLTAKFGERQEPHGMKDTAPSRSEVAYTAKMVRPGENNREVAMDMFLLGQRQNLRTDDQQPEECSRSIDSTGSAGTPS